VKGTCTDLKSFTADAFIFKLNITFVPLHSFFKKKVAQAGEGTRDLLISFIFSFHHFTAQQHNS
jgi:hypothetical protein